MQLVPLQTFSFKCNLYRYTAESTLSLSIETAAPLTPPVGLPRPYLRVIFTTKYSNHRLFREVLQIVRETNAAALALVGGLHKLNIVVTLELEAPGFKLLKPET
jgi:hypothetical protein